MSSITTFAFLALLLPSTSAGIVERRQGNGIRNLSLSGTPTTTGASVEANGPGIDSCPNNWELYLHSDNSYCCPGAVYGTDDSNGDSAFCCVGATFQVATASFASCFPFCSTASGNGVSVISTTQQSCSTTVKITDADYSSKVSAAATSIGYSGGTAGATTGATRSTTGSASTAAETGASSTSTGGAAVITSGPMAGALMVAGGLLLAV